MVQFCQVDQPDKPSLFLRGRTGVPSIFKTGRWVGVLCVPAGLALAAATSGPTASVPAEPKKPDLARQCHAKARAIRDCRRTNFAVIVDPPFVVAGDLSSEQLTLWASRTIRAAAERLWKRYFDKKPTEPIVIYLFGSDASYRRSAKALFGDTHVPHFGYYKAERRTLVMNISTGGGTLVHELTHALVDFDFERIPDWFNEGLASLYEQCRFEPDDIVGLVNWRLPALQQAIAAGKLRSLRELITADDFHGPLEGLNYAQARYLCMYMQAKGVLRRFYRTFRDQFDEEPTGLRSIEEAFGKRSIAQVGKDYRQWVQTLNFGPGRADGQ